MKVNEDFLLKMKTILSPKEYGDFLSNLDKPYKKGLVINNLKINENIFLNNFPHKLNKLPYGDECFSLDTDEKVGGEILHKIGGFYLQEPSAMIPGIVLPIKDGDVVLDVCASPGGKTFQIARRLHGSLLSNEIDFARAKTLLSNCERLGLNNVVVSNFSTEDLAKYYPNKFDCVLIDAPCSGEGMFRKEEYAITQWSKDYVLTCAKIQEEIIHNVDLTLKNGGYMVYSTCTFSFEENEMNVAKIVDMGYEIVDIGKIVGESEGVKIDGYSTELCKRFYFHKSFGEGQFVAVLRKVKDSDIHTRKERPVETIGNQHKKMVIDFFSNCTKKEFKKLLDNNLYEKNDAVYYVKDPSLLVRDKGILSLGVKLGNIIKNRFEPCHNVFTAFGCYFNNVVELNEKDSKTYLKGDTLTTDLPNGWCVLNYLGVSIGGGKTVNGLIKNHYPKGLRG